MVGVGVVGFSLCVEGVGVDLWRRRQQFWVGGAVRVGKVKNAPALKTTTP